MNKRQDEHVPERHRDNNPQKSDAGIQSGHFWEGKDSQTGCLLGAKSSVKYVHTQLWWATILTVQSDLRYFCNKEAITLGEVRRV